MKKTIIIVLTIILGGLIGINILMERSFDEADAKLDAMIIESRQNVAQMEHESNMEYIEELEARIAEQEAEKDELQKEIILKKFENVD